MIWSIVAFIIILGIIVFSHELGHFIVARRLGVKIEEFGFGFPPRIIGIRKVNKKWRLVKGKNDPEDAGGTIYSLNWIPIGGFVRIKGTTGEEKDEKKYSENDSFVKQKIWKRISILSAGVVFNLILAMIILAVGFMIGLPSVIDDKIKPEQIVDRQIQIYEVLDNTPAAQAGLKMGDVILAINGQEFTAREELISFEKDKANQEINLTIKRADKTFETKLTLVPDENEERGIMGTELIDIGRVKYPILQSIWLGIKNTFYLIWEILKALYILLRALFLGQSDIIGQVAGPVGIAVLTNQFTKMGFAYLLQFGALLSINLAIFNFLPIPALDGGRILFLIIEKIRRGKQISYKTEGVVHTVGFALLMLLVLVVTVKDVSKFSGNIANFFKNLF